MTGNMADAQKFLHRLAGKTLLTFQTFDDRKKNKKKDQKLSAVFHGDLDSYASKLMDLNQKGAGVFLGGSFFLDAALSTSKTMVTVWCTSSAPPHKTASCLPALISR